MAKKTCIRVMAPYLPLSTEEARALTDDESVFVGISDEERSVIDVHAEVDGAGVEEEVVEGEIVSDSGEVVDLSTGEITADDARASDEGAS